MTEKTYTKIFEDEAEGVKITLSLEDGVEKKDKPFNLNFALMELANQLVAAAKKEK
jgi:hypothetical protein